MLKRLKRAFAGGMLAMLTGLSLMAPAKAKTQTFAPGGIRFELPQGWQIEDLGERMRLYAKDDAVASEVGAEFWTSSGDLKAVAANLKEELGGSMTEIEIAGKPEFEEINGMAAFYSSGTGIVHQQEIEWIAYVVMADQPVFFVTYLFANPEAHEDLSDEIAESIEQL